MSGIADFTSNIQRSLNRSIYHASGKLAGIDTPEDIAASPITYITSDDPPFLIFHGDRDEVVQVEQAHNILQSHLTNANVSSTLMVVTGDDHSLQSPTGGTTTSTNDKICQMIITFLETNLK